MIAAGQDDNDRLLQTPPHFRILSDCVLAGTGSGCPLN